MAAIYSCPILYKLEFNKKQYVMVERELNQMTIDLEFTDKCLDPP